jgi:hypothetical protein
MALPQQNLVVYIKFDICTDTTFIIEKIGIQHTNYSTHMKRLTSNKDLAKQIITWHCVQFPLQLHRATVLGPLQICNHFGPKIFSRCILLNCLLLGWSGKKKHEYSVLKLAKFLDYSHKFRQHETRSC